MSEGEREGEGKGKHHVVPERGHVPVGDRGRAVAVAGAA